MTMSSSNPFDDFTTQSGSQPPRRTNTEVDECINKCLKKCVEKHHEVQNLRKKEEEMFSKLINEVSSTQSEKGKQKHIKDTSTSASSEDSQSLQKLFTLFKTISNRDEEIKMLQDALSNLKEILEVYKHIHHGSHSQGSEDIEGHHQSENEASHSQSRHIGDPGYDQMKREGVTNQSIKSETADMIDIFFRNSYSTIVDDVVQTKGNDIDVDSILTDHMKKHYKSTYTAMVKEVLQYHPKTHDSERESDAAIANEILHCYMKEISKDESEDSKLTLICELFTYDPQKTLSPKKEERLVKISHAYGLLLYHYKKNKKFEMIKVSEEGLTGDLIPQFQPIFLKMVSVSPPFVLFIPEQFDGNMMQEFAFCNQTEEKKSHPLHVRCPVILVSYNGKPCVKGFVCKGYKTNMAT